MYCMHIVLYIIMYYMHICVCVCVYLYALESYTACKEVESYDLYEEKNP